LLISLYVPDPTKGMDAFDACMSSLDTFCRDISRKFKGKLRLVIGGDMNTQVPHIPNVIPFGPIAPMNTRALALLEFTYRWNLNWCSALSCSPSDWTFCSKSSGHTCTLDYIWATGGYRSKHKGSL
jgi:hypothetical protein